jgi:hypothetical protein
LSLSLRFSHRNPTHAYPLPIRDTYPAHLILFILSPAQYWVRSTDHEAPHYEVFYTRVLPLPSKAQISSSTLYSQTPSAYVSPSMSATKFHTLTKHQAK